MPHLKTRPGSAPVLGTGSFCKRTLLPCTNAQDSPVNNISAALSWAEEPKIAFAEQGTCHCLSCASEVQGKNVFNHLLRKLGHPPPAFLPGHLRGWNLCSAGKWRSLRPAAAATTGMDHTIPLQRAKEWLLLQRSTMGTKNIYNLNLSIECFMGAGRAWYLAEGPATLGSGETPPGLQGPAPSLLWFPFSLFLWWYSSLNWSTQTPSEKKNTEHNKKLKKNTAKH